MGAPVGAGTAATKSGGCELGRSNQQVLEEEKLLDNLAEVRYRTREETGTEQPV